MSEDQRLLYPHGLLTTSYPSFNKRISCNSPLSPADRGTDHITCAILFIELSLYQTR